MAKYAYEQIKESGTVERGLLGISRIKDLDPLSATISGLPEDTKGVLVPNVIEDSAADKAGITHNDIILEVDGKPVDSAVDLQSRISMLKPGTKVELTIWRDGKRRKVDVELGKRSEVAQLRAAETIKDLGFSVENLTDELKESYGYEGMTGVIVTDVQQGSEAQRQGIIIGVLIKEVNRQPVRNTREFNQAVEKAESQGLGGIMILVYNEGNNDLVTLRLP
jgi:serine protease Do